MGTSTDAVLAYGYDLGAEESLKVAEAQESETNRYGFLKLPWYDEEQNDEGDGDGQPELVERFYRRLYEAIPDAPPVEYGWQCEKPATEHYGVWFEFYCSDEYPMLILTTSATSIARGDIHLLDPAVLASQPAEGEWDVELAAALEVLGITPLQDKPGWLLASWRG